MPYSSYNTYQPDNHCFLSILILPSRLPQSGQLGDLEAQVRHLIKVHGHSCSCLMPSVQGISGPSQLLLIFICSLTTSPTFDFPLLLHHPPASPGRNHPRTLSQPHFALQQPFDKPMSRRRHWKVSNSQVRPCRFPLPIFPCR